jgi:hypothetical protein
VRIADIAAHNQMFLAPVTYQALELASLSNSDQSKTVHLVRGLLIEGARAARFQCPQFFPGLSVQLPLFIDLQAT